MGFFERFFELASQDVFFLVFGFPRFAEFVLAASRLLAVNQASGGSDLLLLAIAQTNLKRMLAYSTISHMGFLLLGLANGTPSGYAAAMFYAIAYAIMAIVASCGPD